ncbi:MAG: hypothetical protein JW941_09110, partial [Candidatus Coatesbacteria bacterium]|nr:hypothetical protein [Candidatus Coatesbacteria bacterium]
KIGGLSYEMPPNPVMATVELFRAISTATREFPAEVRAPGVIIEAGERPNVIPPRAICRFSFRARTRSQLRQFMNSTADCVRIAARTTGCSFSMRRFEAGYEPIEVNEKMALVCEDYLSREGLSITQEPSMSFGAYDIGSLSRSIPVIHPIISRGFENLEAHTEAFRDAAGSLEGIECARIAARVLALTGLRVLLEPDLLKI